MPLDAGAAGAAAADDSVYGIAIVFQQKCRREHELAAEIESCRQLLQEGEGEGEGSRRLMQHDDAAAAAAKVNQKVCCLDYKIPQQKYMQRRQLVMLNQFMAAEFNGQPNMLTSNKIAEKKLNHKTYKTKFFNYNSFYFFMSFKRSKGRLLNFIVCNVKSDLPWQKRIAKFSLELKVI